MKRRQAERRVRRGMSFIEISLATVILAMALLPVFGLIQGGLVRSDVSASYTAATELATSVMNKLLSEEVKFGDLPVSTAGPYKDPSGSVAAAASLANVFSEEGWSANRTAAERWSAEGTAMARTKDNIRYKVELWVGEFSEDNSLMFHYLVNPNVDYQQARAADPRNGKYDNCVVLPDYDYSPFKPNNTHLDTNNPGSQWASKVTTLNQWQVTSKKNPVPPNQNHNFKKLAVRISWSGKPTGRTGLGDATKEFWLISFRANLEAD